MTRIGRLKSLLCGSENRLSCHGRILSLSLLILLMVVPARASKEIPVREFARDGYLTSPALSPSGRHLAGFVHHEGTNLIVVWDLDTGKKTPIARLDSSKQYLHWVEWVTEERLVVSSSFPNNYPYVDGSVGRTAWLIGVDRDGGNMRNLAHRWFAKQTDMRSGGARKALPRVYAGDDVLNLLPDDPDRILLQVYRHDKPGAAVYSMSVDSGRLKLVEGSQRGIVQWYPDHDGRVRMARGSERQGGRQWIMARADEGDSWKILADWNVLQNEGGPVPLGFAYDPNIVYLGKESPAGTLGVYEFDLKKNKFGKLVFAHEKFDVASLVFDERRRVLEGVRWVGDTNTIHFLDEEARKEHAAIGRALQGETTWLVDESEDENRKLYRVESNGRAPRYFLYDRKAKNLDQLYELLPGLPDTSVSEMRSITYEARDGYRLSGYLTLPRNSTGKNLPAVVYPHGGPWARNVQTFDRTAQFLANRGFAVFQPNFRGSTGLGEAHRKAGYREVGGKIQDDITDGVKWMIAQGIADPDRIAIYGGSHGGYAALMGLAQTPELYRCGAALAPVADQYELVRAQRRRLYTAASKVVWGDLSKEGEVERLKARSPINLANRFEDPVLLAHGRHDLVVDDDHSKRMKEALDRAGKESELVLYEDAHGFVHEPNRVDFFARLEAFLLECTKSGQKARAKG